MTSRNSITSDVEKQFPNHSSSAGKRASRPLALRVARVVQNGMITASLVFIACAIDRNILLPGVTPEEIVNVVASTLAMLAIYFHTLNPTAGKQTVAIIDSLIAAILLATFAYGAAQASQSHGACTGPAKIGVWDNTRGCTRMTVATGFAAGGFLTFSVSAAGALLWL